MVCLRNEFKLLTATFYWLSLAYSASAQIVPDATLPINSRVVPGCSVCTIDGGTLKGNNLFHSFSQFSLPTGGAALFNNGVDVQNILTRVTGTNVSNIDGVIQANGGANLFIMNPNGIVLGANAKLDIGGSFVGTTASSVKFADGVEFSAITPNAPLLTVSTPIGLNLVANNSGVTVQGRGHGLVSLALFSPITQTQNLSELRVKPQQTLALVGGNILLDGGVLVAPSGRVELGSVQSGEVKLNWAPNLQLAYTGISHFGDIELKQRGLGDVSGFNSGSIQVQGRSIDISGGSVLLTQNVGFFPSGSIYVNATESLKLNGTTPGTFLRSVIVSQSFADGQSGNIFVVTENLALEEGASFNGIVDINTIAVDSNFALAELPETVAESNNQISNSCSVFARNKFVVMGNGGLPSSPDDLLTQPTEMIEPLDLISSQSSSSTNITPRREIVEAQRLRVDKGEVYLLALVPGNIPNITKPTCDG